MAIVGAISGGIIGLTAAVCCIIFDKGIPASSIPLNGDTVAAAGIIFSVGALIGMFAEHS